MLTHCDKVEKCKSKNDIHVYCLIHLLTAATQSKGIRD